MHVCPRKVQVFSSRVAALFCATALVLAQGCSSKEEVQPALPDRDQDSIPDRSEDRNQNGTVDPGETDPAKVDSDADGIPDEAEVVTLACGVQNDRPFAVGDMPGADSMMMMDAKVATRSMLRTTDNRAPGAVMADLELGVAAALVSKRPSSGVATPSAQREIERRGPISALGQITNQSTRGFRNSEGFEGEQATFTIHTARPLDAMTAANLLASGILNGAALTGTLNPGTGASQDLVVNLMTILRSDRLVVMVAAVAVGAPPSDAALIRLDELTDGTNLARHGSFTRHVCDQFVAKEIAKTDILWVVDDSGSMEDDQQAVRDAASAMADVLGSAEVDFRLAVTRTRARERQDSPQRGDLEGRGLTSDVEEFKNTIVVGAGGGWEPGLETGIIAIDRLLPKTKAGEPANPFRLREDAALVVVHLSDERDQAVECAACGSCDAEESKQTYCTNPTAQPIVDRFVAEYTSRGAVTFAIVGDLPNGCQQASTRSDFEPGQGYVEVANATGGRFGSLCGDMRQNTQDIARGATGVASSYQLTQPPASATIRVAIGPAGQGRALPRNRTNGFDYDAATNKLIFYGDSRPKSGEEVVIAYRRWDFANNPATPPDGCDLCAQYTSCDPTLDTVLCVAVCGDVVCNPSLACLPETASCGNPSDVPPPLPQDCPGGCASGMLCNPSTDQCVVPCEQTGCTGGQVCSPVTHLCQVPNF